MKKIYLQQLYQSIIKDDTINDTLTDTTNDTLKLSENSKRKFLKEIKANKFNYKRRIKNKNWFK